MKKWLRKKLLFWKINLSDFDKHKIEIPIELHGNENYGGWYIYPGNLSEESVIYSFGVGEDASFDQSIIEKYGVQVFAFDPTPKSIRWVEEQELPSQFHFLPYGVADLDGKAKFYPPENPDFVSHTIIPRGEITKKFIEVEMRRFASILSELGHTRIDILKMDIEGAEYAVLDDILLEIKTMKISQLLIEFHHFFPEIKERQTYRAITKILKNGYAISYISPSRKEYCFILESSL